MSRESTVTRRKSGLKSTVWSRRKKKTFNQNRMKKQEYLKNEERLRKCWDNYKCSNIQMIGVPEGEEEEQKMKTYLKK